MKRLTFVLAYLFLLATTGFSQRNVENRMLMDLPTAGTLERGSFAINLRMFSNGGLLGGVTVGLTPRFMFGISYGGENLIGQGDVNWNPNPGIQARLRLIDENFAMPAVTIGFNSQGYGPYNSTFNRYKTKSRGLFAVASKNYAFIYNLGLHGGINYSFETDDGDKDLNLFLGADLSFNREFRVMAEYDFARNDTRRDKQFGSGQGYLNAGFQWLFSNQLFLQLNLKNIFKNGPESVTREIKIGYFEYF